ILDLQSMSAEEIQTILDTAEAMKQVLQRPIKKVPALRGKSVCTLFYEASTRTRTSFETAAKILSADTTTIATTTSSIIKGESFKDTLLTLSAMAVNCFVIRHSMAGAPHFAARLTKAHVINGGDGMHEHPTQGLLDLFTIRERKGRLEGLKVVIVGDILHSRVARSNIWGLTKMGASVTVCGPPTLLPPEMGKCEALPSVQVTYNLREALEDADVVYVLRIQLERMKVALFPSIREYARLFGMNSEKLQWAKPDALVMHPGPMNRGIEISAELADSDRALVLSQVMNGVAVRMAILYLLMGGEGE
ncbi:MAG: aspartate carbamoyltransferase catalytic subunit, partial [Abditibacteriales bacterium]|nr:aspartate carbamoyltransferase catalytic subunit [Abditibacteriales bacterium]MDW8364666.1 aspartate carbamoyltransferase catalytic subunit [Abditibacteriales bacterium]